MRTRCPSSPDRPWRPAARILMVGAVLLAFAAVSQAQFIKGVRVSSTQVDTNNGQLTVAVDVDMYTTLGVSPTVYPVVLQLGNGVVPAIDWGDGFSTISTTSINYLDSMGFTAADSGLTVYRFRGSFSHTYPDASPRTITVGTQCCSPVRGRSFSGLNSAYTLRTWRSTRFYFSTPSGGSTASQFRLLSQSTFRSTQRPYFSFTANASTVLSALGPPSFGTVAGAAQSSFTSPSMSPTGGTFRDTTIGPTTFPFPPTGSGSASYYYKRSYYYSMSGQARAATRGFMNTLFLDVIFGDGFEDGGVGEWN